MSYFLVELMDLISKQISDRNLTYIAQVYVYISKKTKLISRWVKYSANLIKLNEFFKQYSDSIK